MKVRLVYTKKTILLVTSALYPIRYHETRSWRSVNFFKTFFEWHVKLWGLQWRVHSEPKPALKELLTGRRWREEMKSLFFVSTPNFFGIYLIKRFLQLQKKENNKNLVESRQQNEKFISSSFDKLASYWKPS